MCLSHAEHDSQEGMNIAPVWSRAVRVHKPGGASTECHPGQVYLLTASDSNEPAFIETTVTLTVGACACE